ncbi:pseudaminic acid synthase [Azotosporobacter soli]|uniref:pseudaminic acid synthase n=1 Tax=Azotosporobacter soli TaxID=3055040 RepID=UPI0031FE81E9
MRKIEIDGCSIGSDYKPFIIAEMSGNHNQSLERALAIVDEAARAGVQALKIQTYTADTMTIDSREGEFYIDSPDNIWAGTSMYELYLQAYTPWEWHKAIFDRCRERGIIGFSTPFDASAVDFLESLNVPCYKIASFENIDVPLLKKVGQTGKPVIVSTGMASIAELDEIVTTLRGAGCEHIVLLKCTSSYPASPTDANVATIPHMKELFKCQVGLSDHTLGIGVAVAGVALGATVIEKHFTLLRSEGGVDASFSLEPQEMQLLVDETMRGWQGVGQISYGPIDKEKECLKGRRSLYIVQDMRAGEKFTADNLKSIRPGYGLGPKYYEVLLGKRVKKDIKRGTPVSWDLLD